MFCRVLLPMIFIFSTIRWITMHHSICWQTLANCVLKRVMRKQILTYRLATSKRLPKSDCTRLCRIGYLHCFQNHSNGIACFAGKRTGYYQRGTYVVHLWYGGNECSSRKWFLFTRWFLWDNTQINAVLLSFFYNFSLISQPALQPTQGWFLAVGFFVSNVYTFQAIMPKVTIRMSMTMMFCIVAP